jgi:hypothetical protein
MRCQQAGARLPARHVAFRMFERQHILSDRLLTVVQSGVVCSLVCVLVGCAANSTLSQPQNGESSLSSSTCRVTVPNGSRNSAIVPKCRGRVWSGGFQGNHGNGKLWTVLPEDGKLFITPEKDESFRQKFPWWRGVCGHLRITGRRLDGPADPLKAFVAEGYGEAGFQASHVEFPSEGCWEITGKVGEAALTFVVEVHKKRAKTEQ